MVTAFQQRVYDAISTIPRGKVSTYGLVAGHLGCNCAQAVGQALRRNPYAPRVPCHRVIASDRTLGGFSGKRSGPQLRRKRRLLVKEGVVFRPDGRVDPACVHRFSRRPRDP